MSPYSKFHRNVCLKYIIYFNAEYIFQNILVQKEGFILKFNTATALHSSFSQQIIIKRHNVNTNLLSKEETDQGGIFERFRYDRVSSKNNFLKREKERVVDLKCLGVYSETSLAADTSQTSHVITSVHGILGILLDAV